VSRWAQHTPVDTRLPIYAAAGLGYLAIAGLVWVWMVYNSLVDLRQRVRQAWSLVDVQCSAATI